MVVTSHEAKETVRKKGGALTKSVSVEETGEEEIERDREAGKCVSVAPRKEDDVAKGSGQPCPRLQKPINPGTLGMVSVSSAFIQYTLK